MIDGAHMHTFQLSIKLEFVKKQNNTKQKLEFVYCLDNFYQLK